MSSKIDERVVSMKFNSNNFEKGVESTTNALARLKDSLTLEGINENVDKVASRLGVFGVVGATVFAKLTSAAMDAGAQIGAAMWEPLVEGGRRRALNLEQARFQFKNLGVDVTAIMADVDYAVSGTAYSLDSAAKAAASLSASQVSTGENMKAALRGISGVAALTGQEYDRVADIFSKVAGQGRVMGGELQQLSALGMNASATLKDYMNETGMTVNATESDIRDLASEGKISFDIFSKAMDGAFGANAAAANETYTGSLSNLRSALGRIGALHFEGLVDNTTGTVIFTGQLERQRDLFNALRPRINEVKDALIPLFHLWSDFEGIRNTDLIAFINGIDLTDATGAIVHFSGGLRNLMNAWYAIVNPIKAAWAEVFPPKATTWMTSIAKAFESFTATLVLGAEGGERIRGAFVGFFSIIKTGVNIFSGIMSVVGTLVSVFFRLSGAIIGLITPLVTFFTSFLTGAKNSSVETQDFFDKVNSLITGGINPLIDILKKAGDSFNNFLNGDTVSKGVTTVKNAILGLVGVIVMMWNALTKGDFTSNPFFSEDSTFVNVLFNIRDGVLAVIDAFKVFGKGVGDAADRANSFWGGVGNTIQSVWAYIAPIIQSLSNFVKDLLMGLDVESALAGLNAGALVGITVALGRFMGAIREALTAVFDFKTSALAGLDGLVGVLESYQNKLKADMLVQIAVAIVLLAGGLWVLSTIDPERLITAVTGMATSFGILLGAMAILDKIEAEPSLKAAVAMGLIAAAVGLLAIAVSKMGQLDPKQLATGLAGVAISLTLLVGAAQVMSEMEGDILKASFAINLIAGALLVMAGVVALFGVMPIDMLVQGLTSVAIVLGALVGAAVLLSKFASQMALSAVGLMAMATALGLLIVPILALGVLPFETLQQGMLALGIALLGLVAAALILGTMKESMVMSAVGLLAMAGALNLLVGPLIALGVLPIDVLTQGIIGLAAVMAVLVIAALAMQGATAGVVGMMAMAAAILVLSVSLAILAGLGMEGIATGIVGLVAAIIVLALTAGILTPLVGVMAGVAAVMGLFALGALALSAAVVVMAFGLGMMGPALQLATEGLLVFAKAAPKVVESAPAMLVLGAALLVFGAGALVAGAAALVLGAGLVLLGAGLALVGAVGVLGAYALVKVAEAAGEMLYHVPGMIGTSAAFVTLGAGTAILGAGLLVLAAGAMLAVAALAMIIPLGMYVSAAVALITVAFTKLLPVSESMETIAAALKPLGKAVTELASSGSRAASGLIMLSASFAGLAAGATVASAAIKLMAASVPTAITLMVAALQRGPVAFMAFSAAVIGAMTTMNAGLSSGARTAEATASRLGSVVGNSLVSGIRGNYTAVHNASVTLGDQMIAGMNRGLQNGSSAVNAMAAKVANTALQSARRTLGVASPAKELIKVGEYYDEGFVGGMENNLKMVSSAGAEVANAALSATQKAISNIKNAVDLNMDFNPSIRPVLDLSAIQRDSGLINDMLNAPSLSVDDSYAMASSLAREQRDVVEAREAQQFEAAKSSGDTIFNQYNNSPKALSTTEIYRNTRNQISTAKGALKT